MLNIEGLTCIRDDRALFSSLSFSLESGDILQLEGPNGTGKTSLLRILCGLRHPNEGRVLWQGESIDDCRNRYYQSLLYIGHKAGVKDALTVQENLNLYARLGTEVDAASLEAAIRQLGLYGFEESYIEQLSAGQRRRVALARLAFASQTLWILDEPFTALDKQGVAWLEQQLVLHAQRGGMVVLTTHQHFSLPDWPVRSINLGQLQ